MHRISLNDRWKKIISNVQSGIYMLIASGGSKKIYHDQKTGKVYATEQINSSNVNRIFQRLEQMSKKNKEHVLIPYEFVEVGLTRYWEMDFCAYDLDRTTGGSGQALDKIPLKELSRNFEELESTVRELHNMGITAMDIKPANMLFACGKHQWTMKITDLDGAMIDGLGTDHLTAAYTYYKFIESRDFVKNDLFALYTSFLRIIDVELWSPYSIYIRDTLRSFTDEARQFMVRLDMDEEKVDLVNKYLKKLNDLENAADHRVKEEKTDMEIDGCTFIKLKY